MKGQPMSHAPLFAARALCPNNTMLPGALRPVVSSARRFRAMDLSPTNRG